MGEKEERKLLKETEKEREREREEREGGGWDGE